MDKTNENQVFHHSFPRDGQPRQGFISTKGNCSSLGGETLCGNGIQEIRDYIRRQKPQDLLVLEEVPMDSW